MKSQTTWLAFLLMLMPLSPGCGKDAAPPPALGQEDLDIGADDGKEAGGADAGQDMPTTHRLVLEPREGEVMVGESMRMRVVLEEDGVLDQVEDTSSLSITLSPSGIFAREGLSLLALRPGEAQVEVCWLEAPDTCDKATLTVTEPPVASTSLILSPPSLVLTSQEEARVELSIEGSEDTREIEAEEISWESTNEEVGYASGFTVYALAQGDTELTASVGELSATLSLSVRYRDHLEWTPVSGEAFLAGESAVLEVNVMSEDGLSLQRLSPSQVVWEFADEDAANVEGGKLHFLHPANLTVKGFWQGISGQATYPVELKWKTFDCGDGSCCGIATNDNTYCWGVNSGLTLGQHTSSFYPVHLPTPSPLVSLSVGWVEACGLDAQGKAWCWGKNNRATVGDGTRTPRSTATAVDTPLAFKRISASGTGVSCALSIQDKLYCWGAFPVSIWRNSVANQPGDATVYESPVLMSDEEIDAFTLGALLCARRKSDHIWMCQGENEHGQIGDGTNDPRLEFFDVPGSTNFSQMISGSYQTCALDLAGQVWCWGTNVEEGVGIPVTQGPTGPTDLYIYTPTRTAWPNSYQTLYGERSRAWCGISEAGIECWGGNATCLLDSEPSRGSYQTRLITDDAFLHFDMGGWFACILTPSRDIECWGAPPHGPDAFPPNINRCSPGRTPLLSFEPSPSGE